MFRKRESRLIFQDRQDAGRQLAERLLGSRYEAPVVLALPRGGVVVGYEVALALEAPLDVIVARKLGAPGNPEFGFGAVGPGGVRVVDDNTVRMLGLSEAQIEQIAARETEEMERRMRRYHGDRPPLELQGRTVILVDDGLATGVTARSAIQAIRAQKPRQLVLAVPVSARDTAEAIRSEVDELVCLNAPLAFMAVGQWYHEFGQTSDGEVIELLERARQRGGDTEPDA